MIGWVDYASKQRNPGSLRLRGDRSRGFGSLRRVEIACRTGNQQFFGGRVGPGSVLIQTPASSMIIG